MHYLSEPVHFIFGALSKACAELAFRTEPYSFCRHFCKPCHGSGGGVWGSVRGVRAHFGCACSCVCVCVCVCGAGLPGLGTMKRFGAVTRLASLAAMLARRFASLLVLSSSESIFAAETRSPSMPKVAGVWVSY